MQSWPRKGDFQNLVEWGDGRKRFGVAQGDDARRLKLGPNEEWILEVIREAAEELPRSIIEGQESEYAGRVHPRRQRGAQQRWSSRATASASSRRQDLMDGADGRLTSTGGWTSWNRSWRTLTERLRRQPPVTRYKFSSN